MLKNYSTLYFNYSAYYTHTMQNYNCYYTKVQNVLQIVLHKITNKLHASTLHTNKQWLPQWIAHLRDAPSLLTISPSASRIHTPVNFWCWQDYLATYPSQELVQFFLKGLVQGFKMGFNNSINSLHSAKRTFKVLPYTQR